MAQEYAISETTLTTLGDAVRKHAGATKMVQVGVGDPVVKISKTTNALSFTERSGGYGNTQTLYDVISIPGASKIVVDIAYQTEDTNYDWVQIAVGSVSSAPSTSTYPKYGGQTLTRKELIFENTDTITFYFKTDSSTDAYLGYYAECYGYDEEGNIIREPIYEEAPNTMTVDTMISTINNLSFGFLAMKTGPWYPAGVGTFTQTFSLDFSKELGTEDDKPFYFYVQGYYNSTSYPSCLILYYDGNQVSLLNKWPKTTSTNYLVGRYKSASISNGILTVNFSDKIYATYNTTTSAIYYLWYVE